jgi:hypothetical protein
MRTEGGGGRWTKPERSWAILAPDLPSSGIVANFSQHPTSRPHVASSTISFYGSAALGFLHLLCCLVIPPSFEITFYGFQEVGIDFFIFVSSFQKNPDSLKIKMGFFFCSTLGVKFPIPDLLLLV